MCRQGQALEEELLRELAKDRERRDLRESALRRRCGQRWTYTILVPDRRARHVPDRLLVREGTDVPLLLESESLIPEISGAVLVSRAPRLRIKNKLESSQSLGDEEPLLPRNRGQHLGRDGRGAHRQLTHR